MTYDMVVSYGIKQSIGSRESMEDCHVFADVAPGVQLFGVYDGHGGSKVASMLASDMHTAVTSRFAANNGNISDALSYAFTELDRQTMECDEGSTATVAVLTDSDIVVAHCGDCRAILKRHEDVIQLTVDHHPDNAEERLRIEENGGMIFHYKGADRVMGMLGMTRAFGDKYFRQVGVISDPDIKCISRTESDDFLLLASDGLFEALSNEDAAALVNKALKRAKEKGVDNHGCCRIAANMLISIAKSRGARDNITVIVVMLSSDT